MDQLKWFRSSLLVLSLAARAGADQVAYRYGTNGYTGVEDVSISTQYGGNGVTNSTDENEIYDLSGPDGYIEETLIRFNNLSLPQGAVVTSAQLTVVFDNWQTGFTVD